MKVFRTSFYVSASVERNWHDRFGRDVDATSFLRPGRIRTSGKLSYGASAQRPWTSCRVGGVYVGQSELESHGKQHTPFKFNIVIHIDRLLG